MGEKEVNEVKEFMGCMERNMKSKEQYYLLTGEEAAEEHDKTFLNRRTDIMVGMRDPKPESYSQRVHRRKVHNWHIVSYGHCMHCSLGERIIEDDEPVVIL